MSWHFEVFVKMKFKLVNYKNGFPTFQPIKQDANKLSRLNRVPRTRWHYRKCDETGILQFVYRFKKSLSCSSTKVSTIAMTHCIKHIFSVKIIIMYNNLNYIKIILALDLV